MLKTFVIHGETPSKKNSKQISCRGGKIFVRVSDRYKVWHEKALEELHSQRIGYPIQEGPLKVTMKFYHQDKRRRDSDNGVTSVFDTLKDAGIITDDNWFVIGEHHVENHDAYTYGLDEAQVHIIIENTVQ